MCIRDRDDLKRKDLPDPYAYSSWARNVMRKRRRTSFTRRLKNVVKGRNSTERRVQALEVRFLRNLENKIIIRKRTDRKVKVDGRSGKRSWKKRQKLLNAYVNNGSTAGKSCLRRGCEIFPTHPHKRREEQFNAYMPEEGCQKGRCDTFFTHSHRKRQRKVINLGSVKCRTLCTSVVETTNRLESKCVTTFSRSNTLTIYKQNACASDCTILIGHATMSSQI